MEIVKISDIFIIEQKVGSCTKTELAGLPLRKRFIEEMHQKLGLTYVEGRHEGGSLCYQDTPELRAEYRISYSKSDVVNYISVLMKVDEFNLQKDSVLFPRDQVSFWKPLLYIIPVLLFCLAGCGQKTNDEVVLLDLFQEERKLYCQLASMKDSITLQWDNVNELLAESLPEDMPTEEKENMLMVRNASLIRMFQSFDEVEEEVRVVLDHTEQMDMEMSKRITALKKDVQRIELKKMTLLNKLNQSMGPDEVARLQDIHQSVLSEKCR